MKHLIIPGVLLLLFFSSVNLTAQWVQTFTVPTSVTSFVSNGNNLFLAAYYVYKSTNDGLTWTNLNQYGRVLGKNDNYIFSGSDYINAGSIFKTSDNGTTWSDCSMPFICFRTLVVNGNYLYAGIQVCGQANFYRFYMSTNSGLNWFMQSNLVSARGINGNTVFAEGNSGLFKTTDNGFSWVSCGLGPLSYKVDGNGIFVFAGTNNNGVYKSSDNGISWR